MKFSNQKLREIVRDELLKEITSLATFPKAPPRAGHLPGGIPRVLGDESGLPEPWYNNLGFKQVDFPVADDMYEPDEDPEVTQVTKVNPKETSIESSEENDNESDDEINEINTKLSKKRFRKIVQEELKRFLNDSDNKSS